MATRGKTGMAAAVTSHGKPAVMDVGKIEREEQSRFGDEALRWRAQSGYAALRDAGALPLSVPTFLPRR